MGKKRKKGAHAPDRYEMGRGAMLEAIWPMQRLCVLYVIGVQ